MKQSIPRLRRVRFKDGPTLEVLRRGPTEYAARALERATRAIRQHTAPIAGMALVVWDSELASTDVIYLSPVCTIPRVLVPTFVRDRLLAGIAERWAVDDVNEQNGHGKPPPDGAA